MKLISSVAQKPLVSTGCPHSLESSLSGVDEISRSDILLTLHRWAEQGWMRRLASAMANFIYELDPEASPELLLSAAILTQMEGRGHTCLPLNKLVDDPINLLDWSKEAEVEIKHLWTKLANRNDWVKSMQASRVVKLAPRESAVTLKNLDQAYPLVLSGTSEEPLLYLGRYWDHECTVSAEVLRRATSNQVVDELKAKHWLNLLFAEQGKKIVEKNSASTVDWQKLACAIALRSGLSIITGGPGTGKTYTAARLLALLFAMHPAPEKQRIALAAPTGKAAARLRQSIDTSLEALKASLGEELDLATLTQRIGAAKTLHSLLGASLNTRHFRFNSNRLLDVDVLIVDEASMVHLEMMSALLQALPANAKLILLGDKDQLSSVEAGAVLGDLCRGAEHGNYSEITQSYVSTVSGQELPFEFVTKSLESMAISQQTVMLRINQRFGSLIGGLASAVNAGDLNKAEYLLTSDTSETIFKTSPKSAKYVSQLAVNGRVGALSSYSDYLIIINEYSMLSTTPLFDHDLWVKRVLKAFDRFRILCSVHDGEWGTKSINVAVQKALAEANLIPSNIEWYAGRPIMVTRNDHTLGIFNGDVGVVLPSSLEKDKLRAYFLDGDTLRSVAIGRLAHIENAFALTVHKSQGSEFAHTALVLSPGAEGILTRELLYTGITRAKEKLTLIEGSEGLLLSAIGRPSSRESGLGQLLYNRQG